MKKMSKNKNMEAMMNSNQFGDINSLLKKQLTYKERKTIMAVALRLSRGGSNKRPFYRIVAADVRSPRDGRYIERLGTYNPMKPKDHSERLTVKKERIKYWLSVGAKPTDRVAKFLAAEGMIEKPKIYEQTKQDKPRAKTLEKLKAKEEKMYREIKNIEQLKLSLIHI